MSQYSMITVHQRNQVLQVSLNRPEVRNAFNPQMIQELTEVFTTTVLDPTVQLVSLAGEGDLFCSGADLKWMKETLTYSYEENLADARKLSYLLEIMNHCPKPLVAKVQKYALGGGVGIVSVCDYVIAEENAKFALSEVKIGLVAACIGPFLLNKLGASWCRALLITAEPLSAIKASEIGLVHEVVPIADLDNRMQGLEARILANSPNAVGVSKQFLRALSDLSFDDQQALAAKTLAGIRVTEQTQEGLQAFLEKRKPVWHLKSH